MEFYTYAHTKPDGTVFYVGKGTHRRAWKTHRRNDHWKAIVKKYGGFSVEILSYWDKEQDAFLHEAFLIDCFKSMGLSLANKTSGGEGASGYKHSDETKEKMKHITSEETKRKISLARKGRYAGKNHPRFGKPVSEETRQKIRQSNLGGKNSPNTRRIKLKDEIFIGVQSLADYEKVHYKTIAHRIKANPAKWGYEVLV